MQKEQTNNTQRLRPVQASNVSAAYIEVTFGAAKALPRQPEQAG